jgi:hypothetical protein
VFVLTVIFCPAIFIFSTGKPTSNKDLILYGARFEVLLTKKSNTSWDLTACNLVDIYGIFRGTYSLFFRNEE